MSAATILTTAAQRGIDLLNPTAADYADFRWLAEHLAKEARFNGATPGEVYSVAQHLCVGSDAILEINGDATLAAYFLLHDAHEGVLKDDTTPKKQALAEIAAQSFGLLANQVLESFALLTYRHDAAIHEAAGLPWPMPTKIAIQVKHWDIVMFVTEWRDLMKGVEHPNWGDYVGTPQLTEVIQPWPWTTARTAWLHRARKLLPALQTDRVSA